MFVKSNAHCSVIVEYNAKRYMFGNNGDPIEIPVEALISAYKSGHIHAHELVPVENDDVKKLMEENKLLREEIMSLSKHIEPAERKEKKVKKNEKKK